jgi:hypothetical protein
MGSVIISVMAMIIFERKDQIIRVRTEKVIEESMRSITQRIGMLLSPKRLITYTAPHLGFAGKNE